MKRYSLNLPGLFSRADLYYGFNGARIALDF
jgi:hypothetical protein